MFGFLFLFDLLLRLFSFARHVVVCKKEMNVLKGIGLNKGNEFKTSLS